MKYEMQLKVVQLEADRNENAAYVRFEAVMTCVEARTFAQFFNDEELDAVINVPTKI